MMDPIWLVLLLPASFIHGWLTGRWYGVKQGAAGMFDQLYDSGIPVKGKPLTRKIEISLSNDETIAK